MENDRCVSGHFARVADPLSVAPKRQAVPIRRTEGSQSRLLHLGFEKPLAGPKGSAIDEQIVEVGNQLPAVQSEAGFQCVATRGVSGVASYP